MKKSDSERPKARLKVRNLPPAPYPKTQSTKWPYFPTESDGITVIRLPPDPKLSFMPTKFRRNFTPEEEAKMIELMKQGMNNLEIGKIMGRDNRVIANKRMHYVKRGLLTDTRKAKTEKR